MAKSRAFALQAGLAAAAAVLAAGGLAGAAAVTRGVDVGWAYNGGQGQDHYSPLAQITKSNVGGLNPVWSFPLEPGALQGQPMVLGRTLYATTPTQRLLALDAVTGALKWEFDSKVPGGQPIRGLTSWSDGKSTRLVFSNQNMIFLIDPATGKPDARFGDGGHIDLRENLRGKAEDNVFFLTSPAQVYRDLIIVGGGRVAETLPASPSPARAYNVRTGKLVWTFHTIPHEGQPGADTWPRDAWKTQGGANAWQGTTIDIKRGIVFINTGSPSEDFYGADRIGSNRFANSTIALDANTGRRLWDFQQVHHDLWDSDSTSSPLLMSVKRNGKTQDIVVATNKHSLVYAFDRVSGKALWPIRETPFPASTVPGEQAWPTQPIPTMPRPLSRTSISPADLTDRTPEAAARARRAYGALAGGGRHFVPLSIDKETLVAPGFAGGPSLFGLAADRNGVLYASSANGSSISGLVDYTKMRAAGIGENAYLTSCSSCHGRDRSGNPPEFPGVADLKGRMTEAEIAEVIRKGRGRMPPFASLPQSTVDNLVSYLTTGADLPGTEPPPLRKPGVGEGAGSSRYVFTGYRSFVDPTGQSYLKGPLATLNAIDMNTGAYIWTVPFTMGGGPLVTGGGLLLISSGPKLQAYDKTNGKLVWETTLPGFGTTPITYMIGGKQYLAVATGSPRGRQAANAGPQKPGAYVVYALPD
jgi:quinoprotein glucose dehydrogenase